MDDKPAAVNVRELVGSDSETEEHSAQPQKPTSWFHSIKQEADGKNITIQCSTSTPVQPPIQPPKTLESQASRPERRRTRKPDRYGNNVMGSIESVQGPVDSTAQQAAPLAEAD